MPSKSTKRRVPVSSRYSSDPKPCLNPGIPKAPVSNKRNSSVPCSKERIATISGNGSLLRAKPATTAEDKVDSSSSNNGQRQSSGPKRHPHFIAAHLGTPCTIGALDHHLECGHKVSTDQPELCASNCRNAVSMFSKERSYDKAYVCMTCIISDVKRAHDAKVSSFKEELEAIASVTRKQMSRDEVARRLDVVEIGWRELDLVEIRDKVKRGRLSRPFYVEPDYMDAVETVTQERYYEESDRSDDEPLTSKGSSITTPLASQAGSSNTGLNSASRSPSPISSDTSVSSGSARSKLPVRRK